MELGMTLAWQGDVDQAYPLFEEAEAVLAAPGGDRRLEPVLRARLAANRGDLALIRHDYVRAAELSLTAVELNRDAGNDHGVSTALLNLGVANAQLGRHGIAPVLAFQGAVEGAARLLGAAELSHETIEEELGPAERDLDERTRAVLDAAPGRDGVEAALEEGRAMDLEAAAP